MVESEAEVPNLKRRSRPYFFIAACIFLVITLFAFGRLHWYPAALLVVSSTISVVLRERPTLPSRILLGFCVFMFLVGRLAHPQSYKDNTREACDEQFGANTLQSSNCAIAIYAKKLHDDNADKMERAYKDSK